MGRSRAVVGFWLMHCLGRPAMVDEALTDLYARAARGELRAVVGRDLPALRRAPGPDRPRRAPHHGQGPARPERLTEADHRLPGDLRDEVEVRVVVEDREVVLLRDGGDEEIHRRHPTMASATMEREALEHVLRARPRRRARRRKPAAGPGRRAGRSARARCVPLAGARARPGRTPRASRAAAAGARWPRRRGAHAAARSTPSCHRGPQASSASQRCSSPRVGTPMSPDCDPVSQLGSRVHRDDVPHGGVNGLGDALGPQRAGCLRHQIAVQEHRRSLHSGP